MTKVKICGITNLEDALLAAKFGADMLGFNFYEKSPRYISHQNVHSLVGEVSNDIEKIGVFVNMEANRVAELVEFLKLDAVQLHGDEDQKFTVELKRKTHAKMIKAFRVGGDLQLQSVGVHDVDGILLDTYSSDAFGGTGASFNWEVAKAISQSVDRLYLAGGLNAENVAEAIRIVRPFAVDVASGVESHPGKKDPKKLEAFIKNAKNA